MLSGVCYAYMTFVCARLRWNKKKPHQTLETRENGEMEARPDAEGASHHRIHYTIWH